MRHMNSPPLPSITKCLWGSMSALLMLAALPAGCTADTASAPTTKPAPIATRPATLSAATAPMTFDTTTMTIKGVKFTLGVAENNAQIERGLMYRDFMPTDHGMLFVMPYSDKWSFWMHETRIPLDIICL